MPVVLRKRKANQQPTEPAPAKKTATKKTSTKEKAAKAVESIKKAIKPTPTAKAAKKDTPAAAPTGGKVEPGQTIDLSNFGGQITDNDGEKTSLKELVEKSKAGVVLFTYPKASTPGCTQQVCFFRDHYTALTKDGLAIYGLSADSPKANTTFKTKQNLPYPLLCDKESTLIAAIGLKKNPKGTQRGVFAVDKSGKVLVAEAGGPKATLERIQQLVEEGE